MTLSELRKAIEAQGLESAHLDDTVHDAASQMASAANNDGLDGQIDFLIHTCGWTPENILAALS